LNRDLSDRTAARDRWGRHTDTFLSKLIGSRFRVHGSEVTTDED